MHPLVIKIWALVLRVGVLPHANPIHAMYRINVHPAPDMCQTTEGFVPQLFKESKPSLSNVCRCGSTAVYRWLGHRLKSTGRQNTPLSRHCYLESKSQRRQWFGCLVCLWWDDNHRYFPVIVEHYTAPGTVYPITFFHQTTESVMTYCRLYPKFHENTTFIQYDAFEKKRFSYGLSLCRR